MGTLKNTQNDAGMLMSVFLGVCIHLDRDEIFFWSRSEDAFKQLLLQPVSTLAKLRVAFAPAAKKQQGLDQSPYDSQVKLYGLFIEACAKMSSEQVRFWLRKKSRGLMGSLLRKGEIEFLPAVEGQAHIPELPGGKATKTFQSKNFRQDQYTLHDVREELLPTYEKTGPTEASCFDIACVLTGNEIFTHIGGVDAVAGVAFTPEQIRYLGSEQRRKKESGLLSYEGANYFPVLGKDEILRLVSLHWSEPTFPGDDQIGRWHYWVLSTKHESILPGRIFILG